MLLLVCILIYGVVFLHFKTLFINYILITLNSAAFPSFP